MSKRQKYDWPTLLKEFADSGLTQTQFCGERNINAKYFSLCRAKLLKEKPSVFVRAKISPSTQNNPVKQNKLVLKFPHAELHFDTSVNPAYISHLLKASS